MDVGSLKSCPDLLAKGLPAPARAGGNASCGYQWDWSLFPVSCAVHDGWQSQFFCSKSGTGEETATLKYPEPWLLPARHRGDHFFFSSR